MNLHEEHNILVLKDFHDCLLLEGDIVSGYVSKNNKYLMISPILVGTDEVIEDLDLEFKFRNGYFEIPLNEIEIDHMEPRVVDETTYIDYLRGKISEEEFYSYPKPNNGIIYNGTLDVKLSYLRDYLENQDDLRAVLYMYVDASAYSPKLKDALHTIDLVQKDFCFLEESTLVALFIMCIYKYVNESYIYSYEDILDAINAECKFLEDNTNDRGHLTKAMFVERHSQESNYYLFNKYPYLLDVYKKYLSDLVSIKDKLGLRAKAYLDYEGAPFWPVNYVEAEELLLELYNLGDEDVSNTLGYLYYYHDPSGVNNYEKAFKYFSIGAAFSITESRYKMADCLIEGKGVKKNTKLGSDLMLRIFLDTREEFLHGNKLAKFADTAYRMYKVYRDGLVDTDKEYNLRRAKCAIIEAKYAIEERRKTINYIGDDLVYKNIIDSYDLFDFAYLTPTIEILDNATLNEILIDHLLLKQEDKKNVKVEIKSIDNHVHIKFKSKDKRKYLLTFIDYGVCSAESEFEIITSASDDMNYKTTLDKVDFNLMPFGDDNILICSAQNYTLFLSDPEFVVPKKLINKGALYNCVSVLYNNTSLSKSLPVLCLTNKPDYKIGDRVSVSDKGIVLEGTVYNTFCLYESELENKINSYPKVIKKLDEDDNNSEDLVC